MQCGSTGFCDLDSEGSLLEGKLKTEDKTQERPDCRLKPGELSQPHTEHLARRSKVNAEGICFRAVPDSFAAMSLVCGASKKGTNSPPILYHKDTTGKKVRLM